MKFTKKHAWLFSALVIAMALFTAVGATIAYLIVKTDPVTNTFCPSGIELLLAETPTNGGSSTANTYQMVPGTTITKDPQVTITANIDCYVFVKIDKSTNFDKFMEYSVITDDGNWKLVDGETNVYYRAISAGDAENGKSFYVLTNNTVTVKSSVTRTDMQNLTSFPTLTFTAYAIQSAGMTSVANAWTQAFALQN